MAVRYPVSTCRAVIGAVVLTVTLAACSGSDEVTLDDAPTPTEAAATSPAEEQTEPDEPTEPTGSGDLPDPCSLLTTEEIAAATGNPFGGGTYNEALSSDLLQICDWTSDDPFATAQVLLGQTDIESQREITVSAFGENVVELDLADESFRTEEGSVVAMQVGDLYVQVSYIPPGPGDVADITVSLAETALGRL